MKAFLCLILFVVFVTAELQAQDNKPYSIHKLGKDSLACYIPGEDFTSHSQKAHEQIWNIKEVRKTASHLKRSGVITVSMIDEKPDTTAPWHTIGLFQYLHDHLVRIGTYRVRSGQDIVEKYNQEADSWAIVTGIKR